MQPPLIPATVSMRRLRSDPVDRSCLAAIAPATMKRNYSNPVTGNEVTSAQLYIVSLKAQRRSVQLVRQLLSLRSPAGDAAAASATDTAGSDQDDSRGALTGVKRPSSETSTPERYLEMDLDMMRRCHG